MHLFDQKWDNRGEAELPCQELRPNKTSDSRNSLHCGVLQLGLVCVNCTWMWLLGDQFLFEREIYLAVCLS